MEKQKMINKEVLYSFKHKKHLKKFINLKKKKQKRKFGKNILELIDLNIQLKNIY